MRETRNALLVLALFLLFAWTFWAWLMASPDTGYLNAQRWVALPGMIVCGAFLFWALLYEDKLPDTLAKYTSGIYYERDGLCIMPVIRKDGEQAFVHLYYENRYEGECNAIVHLRPPENAIMHQPGARDIHFAFTCPGGAVGVLKQPIAVHPKLAGQVIDVRLCAAVNYPHNRGDKLRSHRGIPCGTFHVDWGTNFRTGSHELSGELELKDPAILHLPIPRGVSNKIRRGQIWQNEILSPGLNS